MRVKGRTRGGYQPRRFEAPSGIRCTGASLGRGSTTPVAKILSGRRHTPCQALGKHTVSHSAADPFGMKVSRFCAMKSLKVTAGRPVSRMMSWVTRWVLRLRNSTL